MYKTPFGGLGGLSYSPYKWERNEDQPGQYKRVQSLEGRWWGRVDANCHFPPPPDFYTRLSRQSALAPLCSAISVPFLSVLAPRCVGITHPCLWGLYIIRHGQCAVVQGRSLMHPLWGSCQLGACFMDRRISVRFSS